MKTIPVLNPRLSGQSLVNLNPYDLLYRSDRREERSKHREKEKSNHQNRTEKPTHKYEKCGESPKVEREREILSYCTISVSSYLRFSPLLSDVRDPVTLLFTALPKVNLTNTGFPYTQLRLIFPWVALTEDNENQSASCLNWKFQLYVSLIIKPKFFTFLHFWWKASYIWCGQYPQPAGENPHKVSVLTWWLLTPWNQAPFLADTSHWVSTEMRTPQSQPRYLHSYFTETWKATMYVEDSVSCARQCSERHPEYTREFSKPNEVGIFWWSSVRRLTTRQLTLKTEFNQIGNIE